VAAAAAASVAVRELVGRDECRRASALLARLWGTDDNSSPLAGDALVSLGHAGACLLGAFDPADRLVGVVVGAAGAPNSEQLYSMIAGVDPAWSGRGVGMALKLAQRAWALNCRATRMTWTFDPLIRRNARFNLIKLGARATEYVADFYPPMHDAVNHQDRPDRLVVDWDLLSPTPGPVDAGSGVVVLSASDAGAPVRGDLVAGDWLVGIPDDIEAMRTATPDLAAEWRSQMREVMQAGFGDGRQIVGFTNDRFYVMGRSR